MFDLVCRLGNNTICTSTYVISKPNATICNTTDASLRDWNPQPANCGAVNCVSPLVLNAGKCSCATPLEIGLQIRNPMFLVIDDRLMDSLRNQTAQELGLQPQQIFIYKAFPTPSKRVEVWMYFFPNDSSPNLSQKVQNNITASFTRQKVSYDPNFTPYLAFGILPAGDVHFIHPMVFEVCRSFLNYSNRLNTE